MGKKLNGNTRIFVAIVALLLTVGLAALAASRDWGGFEAETKSKLSHQHEEIVGLKAVDVTQDTDLDMAMRHVYEDEIETPYIQQDVAEMKGDLAEVKKDVADIKGDVTQILNKLDER